MSYEYVPYQKAALHKKELIQMLNEVQDIVRPHFTFQYHFIGSSSRNMITYDPNTNKGFDFDVNLEVNDEDEEYEPDEIRHIIQNGFNKIVRKHGYSYCQDSSRVFTIKYINHRQSRIEYSCDFAIVYYGKTVNNTSD